MQVRQATTRDLAALVPLFDRYRQFYGQPSDEARAGAFLSDRIAHGGGAAIGFTQLYPSFSSTRTARLFILNDLYVEAAHRRSGAGRALVEAATDYARAEGAAGLTLSTGVQNTGAQALYEALGWVREERFYEYGFRFA